MVSTILVFLNILLLELVLSVDNASVLAVIVNKNLTDEKERKRALRYGILGAYVFRGLSLVFVSFILYNPSVGAWFKMVGGAYLCYLFYTHLTPEADSVEEGNVGFIAKMCKAIKMGPFWTTVVMVEVMDIVFSIDNLVACVSMSSNIWVVIGAVFLGILGMRFVAQWFSRLLTKYPHLEGAAFVVILILGIKMVVSGVFDFFPGSSIHGVLNSHYTDLVFSLVTMAVFIVPMFQKRK